MSSDSVGNAASSSANLCLARGPHPMSISRAEPVMPEASWEQRNATYAAMFAVYGGRRVLGSAASPTTMLAIDLSTRALEAPTGGTPWRIGARGGAGSAQQFGVTDAVPAARRCADP